MRSIEDILKFRDDISPFLAHLTKRTKEKSAADVLKTILSDKSLRAGDSLVSDARFGTFTSQMTEQDKSAYFGAICFTETPLSQIHCLLEIKYRQVNLEPYGLVFIKERLQEQGCGPVYYMNNSLGWQDEVIHKLCQALIHDSQVKEIAKTFLPMISSFGRKITPPGAPSSSSTEVINFLWEREWRLPFGSSPFKFELDKLFIGLCPEDEIEIFESLHPDVKFIDPRRPVEWFATKLLAARQRCDLKTSVV